MMTIMRNLTGAVLITAAALGAGSQQSADLRLSDVKAQQPQETIFASVLCQRARGSPKQSIVHRIPIDPATLAPDLNTLVEKSDDVVLAAHHDHVSQLSPSGESTVTYYEVRVIHSWKGSHRAGDILTFGFPGGFIRCEPSAHSYFSVLLGGSDYDYHNDYEYHQDGPYAYVLFLRQSKDKEKQLVQGLRPAAGEGAQGIFPIEIPFPSDAFQNCIDWRINENAQPCDFYLENSQSPIIVPYVRDPLRNKYGGMPASEFLREIQSVVADKGFAEKSSLR